MGFQVKRGSTSAPRATAPTAKSEAPGNAETKAPSKATELAAPPKSSVTEQTAKEARSKVAADGKLAQSAFLARTSEAMPEMVAPDKALNKQYKMPEQRTQLILNSPQTDKLDSTHSDEIRCGAAATTNALIMDSKTPEAAKKNAQAIRKLVQDKDIQLLPEQQRAIDNFEKGSMSPADAAHLQEALYTVGMNSGPGDPNAGLSVAQMGNMVAGLRERGGLANSNPTFHLNKSPAAHWTVTTGDGDGNLVHIDSQKRQGTDYAQMSAGEPKHLTPGGADGKGNESWGGSVSVNNYGDPPKLHMDIPTQTQGGRLMTESPNYYNYEHTLDPDNPSNTGLPDATPKKRNRVSHERVGGD